MTPVVGSATVSMSSLSISGRAKSGPSVAPAARSLSAVLASRKTCSKSSEMMALRRFSSSACSISTEA